MRLFEQKPGIGWVYEFAPAIEDSLYMSARNGDKLISLCMRVIAFKLKHLILLLPLREPMPILSFLNTIIDPAGNWRDDVDEGEISWPRVTTHDSGVDTITGARFGLNYATRVDSLLMLLEKAPNANWEIVWVDGVERADLKDGDILKVTAENGAVKEYYIQVKPYRQDINGFLAAITWPDIPEYYKGIFGWQGDTIPGFSQSTFQYKLTVPVDVDGIPGLVAKAQSLNAKIDVDRATSISGTTEQKTITFTVTAEDDTTINVYTVELVKEKNPINIQPYQAEPFISEFVFLGSNGLLLITSKFATREINQ